MKNQVYCFNRRANYRKSKFAYGTQVVTGLNKFRAGAITPNPSRLGSYFLSSRGKITGLYAKTSLKRRGLAAHFLSTQLYHRLSRKGNPNARGYRIAAFILSFFVIFIAVVLCVFINNVKFMC